MSCWVDIKLKNLDSNAVERSLLLRSPMGQKNLAILTGDRINEDFFLQENVRPFCWCWSLLGLKGLTHDLPDNSQMLYSLGFMDNENHSLTSTL